MLKGEVQFKCSLANRYAFFGLSRDEASDIWCSIVKLQFLLYLSGADYSDKDQKSLSRSASFLIVASTLRSEIHAKKSKVPPNFVCCYGVDQTLWKMEFDLLWCDWAESVYDSSPRSCLLGHAVG